MHIHTYYIYPGYDDYTTHRTGNDIIHYTHKLVSHQFQVSSSSLPTLEESVGLQGQSAGDVAIVLHGGVDLARG